jgi:hypothetical protein
MKGGNTNQPSAEGRQLLFCVRTVFLDEDGGFFLCDLLAIHSHQAMRSPEYHHLQELVGFSSAGVASADSSAHSSLRDRQISDVARAAAAAVVAPADPAFTASPSSTSIGSPGGGSSVGLSPGGGSSVGGDAMVGGAADSSPGASTTGATASLVTSTLVIGPPSKVVEASSTMPKAEAEAGEGEGDEHSPKSDSAANTGSAMPTLALL